MHFRFDFEKTLQAAGVLLHLDGGRMDYIRLLKLLYIADREMLAEIGSPITGDRAVAMKYGPVLSQTYDLIKGCASRAVEWDEVIHTSNYSVELRKDPGRGRLNRAEVEKLTEVTERYSNLHDFDLVELTHAFPEWVNHIRDDAPKMISWQEALEAQGKPQLIEIAERDEAVRRSLDEVFGTSP